MNKIFLSLAFFISFSFLDLMPAYAAPQVISIYDPQGYLGQSQYRDRGSYDEHYYPFNTKSIVKTWVASYSDDFQTIGTQKTRVSKDYGGTNFIAFSFKCNVAYHFKAYNSSDDVVIDMKIKVSDLQKPNCDSEPDESDIGGKDCDICAALGQMKPAIDGVKDAVKENTKEVKEIKEVTKEISGKLTDFHDEFKTGMSFPLTPMPDVSNLLDKNKPSQNNDVFTDNNIYFKDEGDAPEKPSKMPKAPEPEAWPGFEPDKAMPPEKELEKDKEQQRDKEQQKDKELKADDFNKTPEMDKQTFEKTPELQKETFKKDSELEKQVWQADQFNQTETYQKDSELNQTHKYQQTNYMGGD